MTPELDAKLCEKYPLIFKNRYADPMTTAMCWGFDCGDGWYNIIDALCRQIQGRIDWVNRKEEAMQQVVASQVKEKYGTLRFYYDGGDDQIDGMVTMAEAMSARTCEVCGNVGTLDDSESWLSTRCETHKE